MARLVLLVTIGATIATSAPPEWSVGDEEPVSLPPTIPASGLQTQGAVHYRAPRGAWPVHMRAYVDPTALSSLILDKEVVFDESEVRATANDPNLFEVRCREKLCEGVITVDLRVRAASSSPVPAGSTLRLEASVHGEEVGDFFGCQRQKSSTDRPDAPSTLVLDVTLDPFDPALFPLGAVPDAGVPDAGARGSSTLPPLRGIDAGRE